MSDEQVEADGRQRKERLANLLEHLAEVVQAGDLPPEAAIAAELMVNRLEAAFMPGEKLPDAAAGEVIAEDESSMTPAKDEPAPIAVEEIRAEEQPVVRQPVAQHEWNSLSSNWQSRMEIIDQREREAIADKDTQRSILAAFNAGLMRMALRNEQVLDQANIEIHTPAPGSELTDPLNYLSTVCERLQRFQPLLDAHLRLMKQIERFTKIDARFASPLPVPQAKAAEPILAKPATPTRPPQAEMPAASSAFQIPQDRLGDRRPGELAEMLRAGRGQRVHERNGKHGG